MFRSNYQRGLAARPHSRDYKVGSVIGYETFDGTRRKVVVTAKVPQIKNGRDGFDGHIEGEPDNHIWGYDYQVIRVFKK